MIYLELKAIEQALKTLIFILIISSATSAQIPDTRTDREREGYRGAVKRVDVSEDFIISGPNNSGIFEVSPIHSVLDWQEFDIQGKQISYGSLCGMSNLSEGHYIQKFDKNRNLLIGIQHDRRGIITAKVFWQYDSRGREISLYTTDARGQLKYKWIHEYEDGSSPVVSSLYRPSGLEKKFLYSYNSEGEVFEQTWYDGKGTLIEKQSFQYEYDKNKNWIKRVESKWIITDEKSYFKPIRIDYRKIIYFD